MESRDGPRVPRAGEAEDDALDHHVDHERGQDSISVAANADRYEPSRIPVRSMTPEELQQEIDAALAEVRRERTSHLTYVPKMRNHVETVRREHAGSSHHLEHPEQNSNIEERLGRLRASLAAVRAALRDHSPVTVLPEHMSAYTGEWSPVHRFWRSTTSAVRSKWDIFAPRRGR